MKFLISTLLLACFLIACPKGEGEPPKPTAALAGAGAVDGSAQIPPSQAQPALDKVLVEVNGVPVMQSDLRSTLAYAQGLVEQAPAADRAKMEETLLDKLVQDELLIQHAAKLGLVVSREALDQKMDLLKQRGGGQEAFEWFKEESGLDEARVRKNLGRNMMIELLMGRIRAEIKIDPASVQARYDTRPELFASPPSVRLAHILFTDDEEGKALAAKVHKSLLAGADFSQQAKKHSQDSFSKERDGVLGDFDSRDLQEAFAQGITGLKVGQVSEVITSKQGLHVLKLLKRVESQRPPLEQVRQELLEKMLDEAVTARMKALIQRLSQEASVRRLP